MLFSCCAKDIPAKQDNADTERSQMQVKLWEQTPENKVHDDNAEVHTETERQEITAT